MMRVPFRLGPAFAATSNTTEPLPLPLAPAVIVSHGTVLVAVHGQPVPAETATVLPAVLAAVTERLVGLIVTVHVVPEAPV